MPSAASEVDLPLKEWEVGAGRSAGPTRRERAFQPMEQCSGHRVAETNAEIMPCIDDIQARIHRGAGPQKQVGHKLTCKENRDEILSVRGLTGVGNIRIEMIE